MLALIKNGSIPKDDSWVLSIIEFFVLHGMFSIEHANKKSTYVHLQTLPSPSFSDGLHAVCRTRLSSVLGELTSESSLVKGTSIGFHLLSEYAHSDAPSSSFRL